MSAEAPSYVTASLSCGDPVDVTVEPGPYAEFSSRPYMILIRSDNGLKSTLHLSAAAAEALVDGLIEALVAGGDRHDPAPF